MRRLVICCSAALQGRVRGLEKPALQYKIPPMKSSIIAILALVTVSVVSAQTNPRIGKWKLKSDAPAPALNIMTYEPWGEGGMKVTVEATNGEGRKSTWTYNTMFDGKDMPVSGDTRTETTAVKKVDEHTNEITNKRGGKVTQVIINVLSADGNTIDN